MGSPIPFRPLRGVIPTEVEGSAVAFSWFRVEKCPICDCSCFSGQHPISGAFEIGWFKIVPIFAHVDPRRIGLFDERGFLFAAASLSTAFRAQSPLYILIAFEPHKAVAVALLCESIVLFPFVFKHALEQIAGSPDVNGAAAARHDMRSNSPSA